MLITHACVESSGDLRGTYMPGNVGVSSYRAVLRSINKAVHRRKMVHFGVRVVYVVRRTC